MITITFHYRYRKQLIIAGLSLLIISSTIICFLYNKPSQSLKKDPVIKKTKVSKEKNDSNKDLVIEEYKVDIKGEVNNPGIYTMSSSSRVIDQTCPIMIQRLNNIFQRNPLISIGI